MVVTLQDMTAVEELERLRAEFLAMVSHELRAPLTSIKGSASTVLGSPADMDPALVRQFFRIIDEQADHMHGLVADLLDVARIETGTLPVAPEPAEVAALVDRARSAFISAGGRNNLAIDIEPGLPLVVADRLRIVQVLGNLLSNAARHSLGVVGHKGERRAGGRSRCVLRSPTWGGAYPPSGCPTFSGSSPESKPRTRGATRAWASPSARGWWRRTGAGDGPRATGLAWARGFSFTLPTVEQAGGDTGSGPPALSTPSSRREVRAAGERVRVLAVDDNPQDLRYVRDTLTRAGLHADSDRGPGGGAPPHG